MKNTTPPANNNVFTFDRAISSDYHPSAYSFHKDDIPTGEYRVSLDFMIWANKVSGIDLFCTVVQTGQKIRLTVFRDREENYRLHGVDVRHLQYGNGLTIQVELNGRDKPTLHKITVLAGISGDNVSLKSAKEASFFSQKKWSKRELGSGPYSACRLPCKWDFNYTPGIISIAGRAARP